MHPQGQERKALVVNGNDGHIVALTPFKYRDLCKSIPGAQWNSDRRFWHWYPHPLTALELHGRFPQDFERSPGFMRLVDEAQNVQPNNAARHATDLPPVAITKRQPWTHQLQAYHFARGLPGALLAMHMGTGKTKVAIDLCQNRNSVRVLVLTKLKVIQDGIWARDFGKDCALPHRVLELDKGPLPKRTEQAREFMASNFLGIKVVVINHQAALSSTFANWALKQQWDCVIVDESHSIKAPGGKISRFCGTISSRAKYRIAMTGTPMPNGIMDAYAQFRFIDPRVFGTSFASFRARYAIMGGFQGREILGYQNDAEFRERFRSVSYEATKDVLDLPPFHHVTKTFPMGTEARRLYSELQEDFITYLDGNTEGEPVTASNVLARLTRLAQITSGYLPDPEQNAARWIDSAKSDALLDLLEDLPQDEPIVVFARFKPEVARIRELCHQTGRTTSEISGSENTMAEWKAGNTDVIVVNIAAGGAGIDLTRAHTCIYWSTGFNLGDYDQSTERVHRPGQTESTTFFHLHAQDTVDERIWQALGNKRDAVKTIMEEGL